jgi:predicted DNA-binding transcriptional regulator YafY
VPRPTARVLTLLELLQAGGIRTAADLGRRLQVDERTVRRYVEHLIELEVPVETVRGRHGGYRIGAGYRVPPLMLTDDEAVATVLGLAGVARSGPTAARTAAETAAAKLRRVLPERLADRVAGLLDVRTTASAEAAPVTSTDAIVTVSTAAREHRPLLIRHRRRDGEVVDRTLLPWGVVEHRGRWFVAGQDSRSDEVRTFRIDRLDRVEIGEGRFRVPEGADAVREVLRSLASAPRDHAVRVLIEAPEDRVRRHLPASLAVLESVPGMAGWLRVSLEARQLDWVAGTLALIDAPFRIEQPEALRDRVLALAAKLAERAAAPA